MKKIIVLVAFLVILVPLAWALIYKYEGTAPQVAVDLPSLYLKKSYTLELNVKDGGTGLRNVRVSISQKGDEKVLLDKTYPASSVASLFSDHKKSEDSFSVPVEPGKYGMVDGEAVIRIRVADFAWRGWNKGNVFNAEKQVIIDSKPPKIEVLTRRHNVERGGACLVIYRLFEENVNSGVKVGDHFFPGHSGMFDDPSIHAAFFALDHTQGPGTRMWVTARDVAGNVAKRGFHHYIRDKNFKTDVLNISDRFLEFKMPDFDLSDETVKPEGTDNPDLAKFMYINSKLRQANVKKVLSVPSDTKLEVMWSGRFGRLPGSANRAAFADRRIYKHNGREIDRAYHMGIDLASTSQAKVTAANSGRVIMADHVGIFGNTVILDHGFGLASLYAHLSHITVTAGDEVKKGDLIGNTGLTGLAGGDHLHFSMIVHDVFVNPVEWWDPNWIKNNITSKIETIQKLPSN